MDLGRILECFLEEVMSESKIGIDRWEMESDRKGKPRPGNS